MHATGGGPEAATGEGPGGAAGTRRRVGPYSLITELDDPRTRLPVPERRYIARSTDGRYTVLLSLPRPGSDAQRFMAEAEASRYLLGPCAAPVTALAAPGEAAWCSRPYLPVLPLPTALAVHGGPLPERTVRAVGVALAETLAVIHGQGLTYAGVSPAAVLLTAEGPRLSCFGAVRAAAPDGTPRSGLPGLESGSLPRNRRPEAARAPSATCTPSARRSPTRRPATRPRSATNSRPPCVRSSPDASRVTRGTAPNSPS